MEKVIISVNSNNEIAITYPKLKRESFSSEKAYSDYLSTLNMSLQIPGYTNVGIRLLSEIPQDKSQRSQWRFESSEIVVKQEPA